MRSWLYTAYAGLFMTSLFISSETIEAALGAVGLLVIVSSFKAATRMYQIISFVFLCAAITLVLLNDVSLQAWYEFFTPMALLLTLLYLLPFIQHFMTAARLDQALFRIVEGQTQFFRTFYIRMSFTTYVLSLFIFFTAIPLMHRFISQRLRLMTNELKDQAASRSILRAFASVNAWSPIEVYIVMSLQITSVAYGDVVLWLLGFSLTMLLIDWAQAAFKWRKIEIPEAATSSQRFQFTFDKRIIWIVLFFIMFLLSAAFVSQFAELSFFEGIILVIVPYVVLWALILRRFRRFIQFHFASKPRQMPAFHNFMVLFISLGVFNEVVERSGIMTTLASKASFLGEQPLLLFLFIQTSTLLLSLIGIHPLVTLSVQGLLVAPFLDDVAPLSVAIVLVTSVVANDAAGTFGVPVTMMSQLTRRSPYKITAWNLGYAYLFGLAGVALGMFLL
ncbi:hypothetical protein B0H94_103213 [Salsuginibacillus halophilus]|uniref:Uncharacterized protein n=1 Tax=Salsuginibacillus halophilus TaxID=517424 RepID=A0A2P8HWK2_9BACI|nr:hypothetical protein [Salsuginibacillus halophilus]PSL50600.1 hypothetical protein B0H94_103213 [Salsuginibacillus halophilus]